MSDAPDTAALRANTVFAVRNDRLGGRLGAMLNARRLADELGATFRFTWSAHENVSPELQHPEHLFSEAFLEQYREVELGFGQLQNQILAIEALPGHLRDEAALRAHVARESLRCTEAMRAMALPWEDPAIAAERVAQALDSIGFQPVILEAMRQIRAHLGSSDLVAYHLRRGDIIDPDARPSNVLWPAKYIPRVYYEEHIARVLAQDPDARIVIFSDAPHEVAAFCAMSDRVISAADLLQGAGTEILQRDFLELYTMSLCKRIVAPGASAFSSVAAILGNSRIIPITSDLSETERETALARMTVQLDSAPEAFAGDADLGQNFPELLAYHKRRGTPDIARGIVQKHHDRGFQLSYIYDLLAAEHFWAGDTDAALGIVESLKSRPILTDLANAPVYAWAGLAALRDGRLREATRLAHIAQWLQPTLPIARILVSNVIGQTPDDRNLYPVDRDFVLQQIPFNAVHRNIARRLAGARDSQDIHPFQFIPFESELRDWRRLQTPRFPSAFWNLPNLRKVLGFFRSSYRNRLEQPNFRSFLGQWHMQAEEPETGAALIREAFAEDPDNPLITIRQARLTWAQGRKSRAIDQFAQARALSGNQICFAAEYGLALMARGNKQAAIEVFEDIATQDHDMIEIHIQTADMLRRQARTRELALTVAARVDAMVPGAVRTSQIHRKALRQLGRDAEADAIEAQFREWKRNPGKFASRIETPPK
ncbi:MAG: hypothetical protein Q4G36_09100 [Paracoccus sp. (in: a-proteobacteria)]|nr:hypothetical protein [Paracoccus sp. (in: a-proteobacteria)]